MGGFFFLSRRIFASCPRLPQGMCTGQCKHWRILLFSFSVSRKEKKMQASLLFRTAPRRSASLSVSDASFPVISLIILKMAALFFLIFVLYNDATKAKELPE
jgi:hypothetical protein